MLFLTLSTLSASAASPKRVLILDAYGREAAPLNVPLSAFRSTLAREFGAPLEFYEISLDRARFPEPAGPDPFVEFLESRITNRPMDLVATFGGPGMDFVVRHHERFFPDTPIVFMAGPPELSRTGSLKGKAAQVTHTLNFAGMVEDILQLQPQTTNIVVVIGASPLETVTMNNCRREFQSFTNRVAFTWLNDLPLEQVLERCATLPPRSFILHVLFLVDVAGTPFDQDEPLRRLHAVANAPVFGYCASELGLGPIGGRLYQDSEIGVQAARIAIRILRGESPGSIPVLELKATTPLYDWRELRRWSISESRLPPGSIVQYRQLTFWEQYRWSVVGVLVFCGLQTALIIGFIVNRAKRRQGEAALRESDERMILAAEAANLGVWIRYFKRSEVWATDKWRALLGFAKSERIDLDNFLQKLHPEDREMVSRTLAMAPERDGHYETEYRVMLPDGGLRWIGSRGRVEFDGHGKPVLARGVSMDITERKLAEAEVSRQRAELTHVARVSTMGELAASVAHELNQPLGAILANAEAAELFLQQDPPALGELRAILADIRQDDERAGEVIRRMRALLRKRELDQQPLEINSVVEDVLQVVSGDAALRKTAISADLAPLLPKILGDRVHLQQVLLNLILNGMDAMAEQPHERRRLSVRTRPGADGLVELVVTDRGHGIEPDKLPRLFEPFYTTKTNGMGMGLSIARRIIEAHRGRIWAENNASGGAAFHVTLPVVKEEGTDH